MCETKYTVKANDDIQVIYSESHDEIYRIRIGKNGTLSITGKHVSNASSNYTYKTVGFTFTVEKANGNVSGYIKSGRKYYSYLYNGNLDKYVKDVRKDGYIETTYSFPQGTLKKILNDLCLFNADELSGDGVTIYLSNIFMVQKRNSKTGEFEFADSKKYLDYSGISKAISWSDATMEKLKHYYDMQISVRLDAGAYSVICEDEDGNLLAYGDKGTFITNEEFLIPFDNIIEHNDTPFCFTGYYYVDTGRKKTERLQAGVINGKLAYTPYTGGENIIHLIFGVNTIRIVTGTYGGSDSIIKGGTIPAPVGSIGSNRRGEEIFATEMAIPSGEDLYFNILTEENIVSYEIERIQGIRSYNVTAYTDYDLEWKDEDGVTHTESERVTDVYRLSRPYTYYVINNFEYYLVDGALVGSGALGDDHYIKAEGVSCDISINKLAGSDDHLTDPNTTLYFYGGHVDGGETRPIVFGTSRTTVESAFGRIRARNDSIVINGKTILDGEWKYEITPGPDVTSLTKKQICDRNALYNHNITIPYNKPNGAYTAFGNVVYKRVAEVNPKLSPEMLYIISFDELIKVHTPVVCDALASENNKKYVQLAAVEPDARNLVLSEQRETSDILLAISNYGNHVDAPGYGTRDYGKYVHSNSVKFPFDVCLFTTGEVIEKETWVEIEENLRVYVPMWTPEGIYDIECRTISYNAGTELPGMFGFDEEYANLNEENYIASSRITVRVSGSFSGLSLYKEGKEYGFGKICPLGTAVDFSMKTVGSFDTVNDYVSMAPNFYFIDGETGERRETELYYVLTTAAGKKLVKIGSPEDAGYLKLYRAENMNIPGMKEKLSKTAYIRGMDPDVFLSQRRPLFYYGGVHIPQTLRAFDGNGEEYGGANISKIQIWYGEYYLPQEIIIAEKGENVFEKAAFYGIDSLVDSKRNNSSYDGYLAVNFKIIANDYSGGYNLDYINTENASNGYCSKWTDEEIETMVITERGNTFRLYPGDLIIYDTGKLFQEEFTREVTH